MELREARALGEDEQGLQSLNLKVTLTKIVKESA